MFAGATLEDELPDGWKLFRRRAGDGWLYFAWGPAGPVGLGWVPESAPAHEGVLSLDVFDRPAMPSAPFSPAGSYGRGLPTLSGDVVDLADAVQALLSLGKGKVEVSDED